MSKWLVMHTMPNIATWDTNIRRPRSLVVQGVVRYRMLTSRLGPAPDFLIIGTQRGGTTSLYHILLGHPNVYPCLVKEPHFFDRHYARGDDWYRAHFPPNLRRVTDARPRRLITGEATPCYLYNSQAPRRIHDFAPDTKLVALLRNPVDRAYSHYGLLRKWGFERGSFEDAIEREEALLQDGSAPPPNQKSETSVRPYLSRGIYADQLHRWMTLFPQQQLFVMQSEAFYRSPKESVARIVDFLGLPDWDLNISREHRRIDQPPMSESTRAWLEAFFRPHNERLFDLLGAEYDWRY